MAQAEFKAWLEGFKGHISVMLAAKTKADILIESLGNLSAAASGALEASFETVAEGDPGYAVAWPTALGEVFGGATMPVVAAAAAVQVGLPAVFGAAALGGVVLGLVALPLLRPGVRGAAGT